MEAQSNAIRTNFVWAKTDKTKQNSKTSLSDDWDKTINHIKRVQMKKSSRDLRRLTVIQIPVKDHQLMLARKTRKV